MKGHCNHRGRRPVRVGPYTIRAGGTQYLQPGDYGRGKPLLVPLKERWLYAHQEGKVDWIKPIHLVDFGGVPANWKERLEEVVAELHAGRSVLAFCTASHGRTGTFLASLIALLESEDKTPDPIAAVRARHCHHAVETLAQAEAIFALRGKPLPQIYRDAFTREAAPATAQP